MPCFAAGVCYRLTLKGGTAPRAPVWGRTAMRNGLRKFAALLDILRPRFNQRVARWVARLPVRIETKLLAAFFALVALLILLGSIGLGGLSEVNRATEDLIETDLQVH